MIRERTCLYRFYDRRGTLLYIGITNNPAARFAQHAADKPWWKEVHRKTLGWYGYREQAEHAEILAIRAEFPRYNIEHNLDNPHRVAYQKLGQKPARRRARARWSNRNSIKVNRSSGRVWGVVLGVLVLMGGGGVGPALALGFAVWLVLTLMYFFSPRRR